MRVPRIYQSAVLNVGDTLELDAHAHKHLVQVLRLGAEREVILFNGEGGEYRAVLTEANKRKASAHILEAIMVDRESSLSIHLAQCVSKGERFELAIQKAVELGVNSITPVFSARSQLKLNEERREKKQRHWQQVIINACEQSGRTRLVNLHEAMLLPEFIEASLNEQSTKLMLHPESSQKLSDIKLTGLYSLLIGPEGGFEDKEMELARLKGFCCVQLGKQILRTETTPIAVIAALNALEKEF